jgi:hypothetical protein
MASPKRSRKAPKKKRMRKILDPPSLDHIVNDIRGGRKFTNPPSYFHILRTGFERAEKRLIFVEKEELETALMKHYQTRGVHIALRDGIAARYIFLVNANNKKYYLMSSYGTLIEEMTRSAKE